MIAFSQIKTHTSDYKIKEMFSFIKDYNTDHPQLKDSDLRPFPLAKPVKNACELLNQYNDNNIKIVESLHNQDIYLNADTYTEQYLGLEFRDCKRLRFFVSNSFLSKDFLFLVSLTDSDVEIFLEQHESNDDEKSIAKQKIEKLFIVKKSSKLNIYEWNSADLSVYEEVTAHVCDASEFHYHQSCIAGEGSKNTKRQEVIHWDENTISSQSIKFVGKGDSEFDNIGRIYIHPKAQKVDSSYVCKAWLKSDSCHFKARPDLEIYADDVKAEHGVAVGVDQKEEEFFLQSRGLSKGFSKELLEKSFLSENWPLEMFNKNHAKWMLKG